MTDISSNLTQGFFKPRSKDETTGLSVSLAVIIALSLLGNFLLIFSFARNERLRASLANKLILSLAVADFTTASFPLSYQLATILDVHLISNGGLLCTIGGLFSYSCFSVSVMTLVMLSTERFASLGYPMKYFVHVTPNVKRVMIAYPWIHGVLLTIFFGSFLDIKFDRKGFDCGLSWSKRPMAFSLSVLVVHVILPFFLLLILNYRTLCMVRTQNRQILSYDDATQNSAAMDRVKQAQNKRATVESKLAKVFIVIVFVFLSCWTPYVVTRLLAFLGYSLSSAVMSAATWVLHASSFANPIIYSILKSDLNRALRSMFQVTRVEPANEPPPVDVVADRANNS